MKKKSILDFQEMKIKSKKIAGLVVYDWHNARFAEDAEMDWLLIGDSVGMSVYGYNGTVPVTMDQMICHSEAVRRGAPDTFIIGDMPFGSYQRNPEWAVINAERFYKEASVDAIKLEGGVRVVPQIKAIVNAGMNVMGHIGLTPQSSGQVGGFKVQGQTAEKAILVIKDALAVEAAGAFAILIEAVPPEVTEIIAGKLKIPVLSIGAGPRCDGQLLLDIDLLGKSKVFTPRFVKDFAKQAVRRMFNEFLDSNWIKVHSDRNIALEVNLADITLSAFKEYVNAVKLGFFPNIDIHCYKMSEGELEKLKSSLVS